MTPPQLRHGRSLPFWKQPVHSEPVSERQRFKSHGSTLPLLLGESVELSECRVPFCRNCGEVAPGIFETALLQLPDTFAPPPPAEDEAGLLHSPKVLGDGLARDAGTGREPGNRQGPVVAEPGDEPQATRISESGKEKRAGSRSSGRPETFGPGTSRRA